MSRQVCSVEPRFEPCQGTVLEVATLDQDARMDQDSERTSSLLVPNRTSRRSQPRAPGSRQDIVAGIAELDALGLLVLRSSHTHEAPRSVEHESLGQAAQASRGEACDMTVVSHSGHEHQKPRIPCRSDEQAAAHTSSLAETASERRSSPARGSTAHHGTTHHGTTHHGTVQRLKIHRLTAQWVVAAAVGTPPRGTFFSTQRHNNTIVNGSPGA
jgi:hypothetical protein